MSISLTPDQERFIQTKLQAGKYRSAEQILEIALRLLDEYDRSEAEWVEDVRVKIDTAIEASKHTTPLDGETFINGILERFQQANQA
ncbi:MAG: type II toxin-antitoxin system ParD family antitoxin [Lyngbya sp. HA4199-MV5]|jgi:antitoxin ParD1/3/4|nr:type II toxin-antitoxin system ParD family antitoxin [Lyngbya sp. HA4199-MV5]